MATETITTTTTRVRQHRRERTASDWFRIVRPLGRAWSRTWDVLAEAASLFAAAGPRGAGALTQHHTAQSSPGSRTSGDSR
ncbi:MAG: hypothetical protein L0Y54_06365 [Sporichthyaceae bacterium]|nr:hypothetical protein [Sporichthyaceae bacterium]